MALTGMHVPIERSFAMASLVVLGLLLGRRVLSLRGLAVAATALLLLSPEQVVGVSFQMSFAAVLALISGYEAMRPWLRRLRGAGGFGPWLRTHLATLALTSLLAGTAALPFAAYDFGRVQLYYVVANMVAVPITAALVMPAGLAALLLMPAGLERLALVPMGWGIEAVLWVGRGVASWPAAVLAVPHIPLWGVCVASTGIAWLGLWRSRMRLAGLLPLAIGLASPAVAPPPDILVSDNAAMIALRTPQGVFLQRRRGSSKFVLEQWLQLWAAPETQPMPLEGSAAGGAIACTGGVCRLRPRPGGAMALLVASGEVTHDCAGAAVLVSAEPARHACPGGPPLVDRFTVWRNGTAAVWLAADGARILTDRAARGARPWVPPPPVPRHHRVRPRASARRAGG
jgi:competence protein ComEC